MRGRETQERKRGRETQEGRRRGRETQEERRRGRETQEWGGVRSEEKTGREANITQKSIAIQYTVHGNHVV